ncbi:hypothetical protein CR513_15721, partial [Mucuna pruriens]
FKNTKTNTLEGQITKGRLKKLQGEVHQELDLLKRQVESKLEEEMKYVENKEMNILATNSLELDKKELLRPPLYHCTLKCRGFLLLEALKKMPLPLQIYISRRQRSVNSE